VAAVLAALAGHLGVQEGDVEEGEDDDEAGVAGEGRGGRRGAAGPKASTASQPMADTARGMPTARRWKVTRKLTRA
jgi:hypothetical protein